MKKNKVDTCLKSRMPAQEPEGNPLEGNSRYEMVKYLNRGSFGYVVQAKDLKTGDDVAIKFVVIE